MLSYQRAQVNRQIRFGTGVADSGVVDLSSRYIARRNQALSAMTDVLELRFLGPSWLHRQWRHGAL
jgi:hypothetical protein